ncbi:hypothetical protein FO519_001585 [Halicephalobus sp. NKZ332]|nr:hypothetical protein FO519_001585 [Halicephalobus sp. NKZ332]
MPQSAVDSLRARWDDLTSFVGENTKEKWWTLLIEAYSPRPFYNLNHLVQMFQFYDEYKDKLKDRYATAFAVFFKHIDDDPRASDSPEKSAQKLHEFSQETTLDQENYIADLIVQSGSNCTDAHLGSDFGYDDLHFLIDFDFAFLGEDEAAYKEHSEAIRKEHSHLSDAEYKEQRLKLLRLFLQIPNIYATKEFREIFEEKARNNISTEIESLSK